MPASALATLYEQFRASCEYGSLDVGGLFAQYQYWINLNDADVAWLEAVGRAFAAAGGSGAVKLADVALEAGLRAAGVSAVRADIQVSSPTLSGIDPATGYIEDPVNSATGNFVLPETDLAYGGLSQRLMVSRMYNSTLAAGYDDASRCGVLGPGWSTILDQRLVVDDDEARWVRDDGREIVFPLARGRSEGHADEKGPWRAVQDNVWLWRGDAADAAVAQPAGVVGPVWIIGDNGGDRCVFTIDGAWVGADSGAGDGVWVERHEDAAVALHCEWGRSINLFYEQGRLVKATASDGRSVDYTYDNHGRLVEVNRPDGICCYRWDGWLLTQVIDTSGVAQCVNTFDDLGRICTQQDATGHLTRFTYLPGGVTVADDGQGHHCNTWISDERGRTVGIIDADGQRTSMLYDRYGNLVSVTDRAGKVIRHAYDDRGHRIGTTLPTGGTIDYSWDDADRLTAISTGGQLRVRLDYDGSQPTPVRLADAHGTMMTMTWHHGLLKRLVDATGVSIGMDYDKYGQLTAMTDGVGATWQIGHDQAGYVTEIVTPLGNRTQMSYDQAGHMTERIDPDGACWSYAYDDAGYLETATAPDGGRTCYTWGPAGQITTITDPTGATTALSYDEVGDLTGIGLPDGAGWAFLRDTMARICGVTDPAGGTWRASYTVTGQLASLTDPTGASLRATTTGHHTQITNGAGRIIAATHVDDYGRVISATDVFGSTSRIDYNAGGLPAVFTDPLGADTRFGYDRVGHLTDITSPTGLEEHYSYDEAGRLASTTDPTGARTCYHYDADSRLVEVVDPTGVATTYTWDPVGRLVETRVGERVTFSADYDTCGRPVRTWDPIAGNRSLRYDQAGRLISAVDAAGQVHRYTWDKRGRLATATTGADTISTYRYNQLDQVIESTDPAGGIHHYTWNPAGRLASHTGPDGSLTTYDMANGTETVTINGHVSTRKWWDCDARQLHIDDHTDPAASLHHFISIDARGLVCDHTTTDDEGNVISRHHWDWDREGRLTRANDAHTSVSYDYREDGLPARITHSTLGTTTLTGDDAGRLSDIITPNHHDHWDHDSGLLCRYTHDGHTTRIARDHQGRVTGLDTPDGVWSYTYNQAGSLITATGPRTHHTWTHDAYGRLANHTTSEDNPQSQSETVFNWDCHGRLADTRTRKHGDTSVTHYAYDPAGRRTSATGNGSDRRYSWDTRGWLSGITTDTTTTSTHVDALGYPSRITTQDQHIHVDWDLVTGTPTSIDGHPVLALPASRTLGTTPTGEVDHWRATTPTSPQDPYQPISSTIEGVPDTIRLAGNTLILDGHPWWGARLYDPATTTFLTPDPETPPIGALWANNPYNYANNNPLTLTDPLGTHPVTDDQLAGLAHPVQHWWTTHKHRILSPGFIGGAILIGLGIGVAATGVGGPIGAAMISGALISGGFSASSQKYTTGRVNQGTFIKDTLIGGVVGGVGAGTTNLVGSHILQHSDTAAALVETYAADPTVARAGSGILAKLRGKTAADNALKQAVKEGDDVSELFIRKKLVNSTASQFTTTNTNYILSTSLYDDKHFSAKGLMIANSQTGVQALTETMLKLPTHTIAPSTIPGYRTPDGFKQGLAEAGKEAAWSISTDIISDDTKALFDYGSGSYDSNPIKENGIKHVAKGIGKSIHTGFPDAHVENWTTHRHPRSR
ncbi:DUF6531 domain-containing protein [Cutibacterium equinum]|uniref:DUF6531 domain-containing protein n=1 Tax=Cutibacterium equinum TaxID=3016342 RepID=A0ABY7QYT7_9ACTN|nr:DUF6531 domain-containing protein [Cutibacterium equinum]WCC80146.1 DUF6531 domain-containing protein [Cutibacterium equinum]